MFNLSLRSCAVVIFSFHLMVRILVKGDLVREVVIDKLTQFPCDILSASENYIQLQSSAIGVSLQSVSIGGWVMPRGFLNQQYTIFSFHESSGGMYTTIYEVAYNPITNDLNHSLLSSSEAPQNKLEFYSQKWVYVFSTVYYSTSLYGETYIWYDVELPFYTAIASNGSQHLNNFDSSTIYFNIGSSLSSQMTINPSCSYARLISIYAEDVIFIKLMNSDYYDVQAMNTQLRWHLDGLYTINNIGYVMNFANEEDAMYINQLNPTPFKFDNSNSNNQFVTSSINVSENGGLVIQFSFKVTTASTNDFIFFQMFEFPVSISFCFDGKLKLEGDSGTMIYSNILTYPNIYQITLIVKQQLSPKCVLIINNVFAGSISIKRIRMTPIQFGATSNSQTFELNSIRIYSGTYLQIEPSLNCLESIMSNGSPHCLVCGPGQLISLQDYACSTSTSTIVSNDFSIQRMWNPNERTTCATSEMQHDQQTGDCRCRKQYYSDGTSCKKCKSYCNGCVDSETICTEQDTHRHSGECDSGFFDRGYKCISSTQLINKYYPSISFNPKGDHIKYFVYESYELNISNVSFLFSFSFQPVYNEPGVENPIAILNLSPHPPNYAVYMFQKISPSNEVEVTLYSDGMNLITIKIHPINPSWFAIWSNYFKIVMYVVSNGVVSQYSAICNVPQLIILPKLCIGVGCDFGGMIYSALSSGIVNNSPFRFMTDVPDPQTFDKEQVLKLMLVEPEIFAVFSLEIKTYDSEYLGKVTSLYSLAQSIDFESTKVVVDQLLKGFGFKSSTNHSKINLIGKSITFPISFSMIVNIDYFYAEVMLISYYYTSDIQVEFYLTGHEQSKTASIRVCVGIDCIDTKTARFNFYEPNYFVVFSTDSSLYSLDILNLSFKVICNYESETVSFAIARAKQENTKLSEIVVGLQTLATKSYLIYINRLYILSGNSYFYEDYDNSENCYILLGFEGSVQSRTCLIPKRNRVLIGGQASTETICLEGSANIRFVNQFTYECIDSNQPTVSCAEINIYTLECTACQPGYFFPSGSNECLICDSSCLKCLDFSTNCLECIDANNQNPPTCECQQGNQILNTTTKLCESCESRCDGCTESIYNCTSCSSNRGSPPECACIEGFFENTTTGECELFKCDSKCSTCSDNPANCITCEKNRGIAPECACIQGAFKDSNGNCQICASGSYYISSSNDCGLCEYPCTECVDFSTKCLSCEYGLRLVSNSCFCGSNSITFVKDNGEKGCARQVEIQLSVLVVDNGIFSMQLRFPFKLKEIDFNDYPPKSILNLSLTEVSSDKYSLQNAKISEDLFSVEVHPIQAFSTTSGQVLFRITSLFVSETEEEILGSIYTKEPIQITQIGPLFLTDLSQSALNLNGVSSDMKNMSPSAFYAFQNFQLIFYLFKSFEPSVLLLLLRIQFPPNLYAFLQTLGMLVYPDVLDYQAVEPATKSAPMFNFDDEQGSLAQNKNQDFVYRRLGFSNSLLITMPLVCLKYIIFISLIVVFYTLSMTLVSRKELLNLLIDKTYEQIVGETEVNLLITLLSVFLNFDNLNEGLWASRYGFYCSILVIAVNAYVMVRLYQDIYIIHEQQNEQIGLKGKMDQKESEKYLESTKMHSTKKFQFINIIQKFLIVGVLYLFQEYPLIPCIVCSCNFLLSAALAFRIKPFLTSRSRMVRIVTDVVFSLSWILTLFVALQETEMNSSISEDLNNSYQSIGQFVVYTLIVANLIYVIEQVFCIVDSIKEYLEKRRKQKQLNSLLEDKKWRERQPHLTEGNEFHETKFVKIK